MWPDRGGPSRASGQGGSGESRGSARNEPTSEAPRQHEAWEGRGTSGALSTTRTFPVCVLLVIPGSHVLENLAPADRVGQRADGDQLWTTLPPLWTECPSQCRACGGTVELPGFKVLNGTSAVHSCG